LDRKRSQYNKTGILKKLEIRAFTMDQCTALNGNLEQNSLLISIATRNTICLQVDGSVRDAARTMAERRISSIVVTDGSGRPAGIITERNILHAMQSGSPQQTELRDIMSAPVITVPLSITALDAYQICLRNGFRHLVLVDDEGLLAGVVSETDFRLHMNPAALAGNRLIVSAMNHSIISMPPQASLHDALKLMESHRDSCVVVTEDERPVGIVTERDIVRLYSQEQGSASLREVMTSPVLTVRIDDSISEAAKRMLDNRVRHLVVVDGEGRLAGLIGEHDLTQAMAHGLMDDKLAADGTFMRTLLDTLPDMIWLKDADGVYLACNARFEQHYGAKKTEIIGKTDCDFVDRKLADSFRKHDRKAMESDKPIINEEWLSFTANGFRGLFETIKTPMRDGTGRLIGVLGIAHDVTGRVQAEAELRASNEKLRSLYELSPMGIARTDMQGRYIEFNDAFRDICGYTREELSQLDYWALTPREYADREAEQLDSLNTRGYYGPYEKEYIRKDGSRIPLLLNGVLIHDSNGQPYIWSIAEDITERKKAEAVLAASELRYRTLVEHSPFCIHEIDMRGHLQSMNRAGLEMIGLDEETEICGVPYLSAVSKQDYKRIKMLMQDAFKGKTSHFEFTAAGDTPAYFRSCFIPIMDAEGRVVRLMGLTEDFTERKRSEDALREREEIFSSIVNQAADSIVLIDGETLRFLEFNQVAHESLGYTRDEFTALTVADLQVEHTAKQIRQHMSRSIDDKHSLLFETLHRRKDGSFRETQISSQPVTIHGRTYISAIWSDISRRKRVEESLRITSSVFDTSQEAIVITDASNAIIEVNPAFTRITGYSREEAVGKNPSLLSSGRQDRAFYKAMWKTLKEHGSWRGEIWNRRKNGEIYPELLSITVIYDADGNVQRHVGLFSDISQIKQHEAELSRVAHYDALTGIPNRVLLADRMKQAIAQTARDHTMMAICYLDLDGFKPINDAMGHETGDRVLVEIARRIVETIRGGDSVARLGGDEFVILLLGLERAEECASTLERLLHMVAQPFSAKGGSFTLSASIGVSIYPLDDEDPDTLLRHADQAMYIAKQSGKNRFHIYDPALDQRARDHHEFMQKLRHALELNQFELHYQPKINMSTGKLAGVEALIRWRHPERGLLLPSEFLHAIENTELDIEVGEWGITTALAQIVQWLASGLDIGVSINISAYHLESHGFVEMLRQKIAQHPGLPPGRLQIEVLETAALEDVATVNGIINACREFGVGFALDDFGTGYSSLTYLSRLPVDVLKIDQSFVRDILEDKGDRAIVQGIIALARAFDRQIVAEGIETREHFRALLKMGCEFGQGYFIAHPMPAEKLASWRADIG
jgi:diguanylate cyclase (GGDEF)-like protein/PAS domain S-box-containing protein